MRPVIEAALKPQTKKRNFQKDKEAYDYRKKVLWVCIVASIVFIITFALICYCCCFKGKHSHGNSDHELDDDRGMRR